LKREVTGFLLLLVHTLLFVFTGQKQTHHQTN